MDHDLHKVSISRSPVSRFRGILIPLVVFGFCLGVTLLSWRSAEAELRRERVAYFEFRVRDAQARLEQRLNTYEQVLRDTHAMFFTAPVNRKDFSRFVSAMHLSQNYPGIQGVGLSLVVPKADLVRHTEAIRKDGFPTYTLSPAGERDLYTSIIYLEPFVGRNLRAFGYDMYSEPVRRAAMNLARDLDDVTISGKVTLVQETDKDRQAGFLMYVPVFKLAQPFTDAPFATQDQQRSNIQAWVYAPFRINDLMAGVFGELGGDLDIEVYDGTEPSPDNLMFDSSPNHEYRTSLAELRTQSLMEIGHHKWTLRVLALPGFETRLGAGKSGTVLGAGIFVSALLTLLVGGLAGGWTRAQQLAAERESRYQSLLQQANDTILLMTLDGTILETNARAEEHFGYSQEELRGLSVRNLHASDSLGEVEAKLRKILDTGAVRFETEHLRKDGILIQSEVSARVVDFAGKKAMLCIVHDISHRKELETALQESEARFRAMFESHSAVMLLLDPEDGHLVDANPAAVSFYGYPQERLQAMHILDINVMPQSELDASLRSAAEQHRNNFVFSHRIASGEIRQVELNSSPMESLGRKLLFSIITDVTERQRADEQLRQLLREREIILETVNVGISMLADRKQVWVNQRVGEIFQYSVEEIIGQSVRMFYPSQEAFDQLGQEAYPVLSAGGVFESLQELVRKDGRHIWVCYDGRAIDPQDLSKGTLWIINDVTRKKEAEDALRESEGRFRNLIEVSPIPFALNSADGKISYLNPAFTAAFGYTIQDIPDLESWWQQAYPDSGYRAWVVTAWGERLACADSEGRAFEPLEVEVCCRDGAQRSVIATSVGFKGNQDETHLVSLFDITDRKRAEEALARESARYRTILTIAHDGIHILDEHGCLVECNDAFMASLGRQGEDPATLRVCDWNAQIPQEQLEETIQALIAKPSAFETLHRRKDGSVFHVEVNAGGIVLDGKLLLLAASRDISARKQAENERRRFDERANQMQRLESLGVLVAGVAHNIRNVLAVIMGTASLHEGLASETADVEAYKIIGKACRRGRDVVQSLTQFAKPKLSSEVNFEFHKLLTEVRAFLLNTTQNRIEVLEAFTGEPLWIRGDAESIRQALVNLSLNALDAMPNGGTLTFRTTLPEPDWVEVSVEDTGEGMSPEVMTQSTEPFFTTKEVGKGVGLGLSMTYGVVKAHGGTLDVSSVQGHGTIVKLRFPRVTAPIMEETSQAPAPVPVVTPLKVILVDDDEDVRFLVARMLKKAGHLIQSVASGEEALKNLGTGPLPDLIILDQNMPRMNGIQTMAKIRALHSDMPILISSGQPDIEGWDCFKQPNVAVISKPFEMGEVLAKLAKMSLKSRIS